jgi:CubicO group peptidase (beta-lactamase class C family)
MVIPVSRPATPCIPVLIIALIALATIPFPVLSAPVTDTGSYPGLDAVMTAEMNKTNTSGAEIVIVRNGSIVYARGFGTNPETGLPMTPDTVVPIDSTTKFFTGYIVASLAEDGLLDPRASVRTFIPEFDPAFDPVTTAELVTHTAGLNDYDVIGFPATPAIWNYPARYFRSFNATAFFTRPGTVFSYSDVGFDIAGFAAARAANSTYRDLVEERITGPLALNSTGVHEESAVVVYPAGEILSTASDLARLAVAYMDAGSAPGTRTLRPGAVRRMTGSSLPIPGTEANPARYGYGVILQQYGNLTMAGHPGNGVSTSCTFEMVPEQRFAYIITSSSTEGYFPATTALILNQTFPWITPDTGFPLQAVQPQEAARIAGTYRGREGCRFPVEESGGDLRITLARPGCIAGLTGNITTYFVNSTGRGGYVIRPAEGPGIIPVDFLPGPDGSVGYFFLGVRAYPVIAHGNGQAGTAAPGSLNMPQSFLSIRDMATALSPGKGGKA